MHMRQLIIFFVAVALVGCSQPATHPTAVKQVVPKTEGECLARGGSWTALGLPMPDKPKTCDIRTTDAGTNCSDSSQCQGICLAPAGALNGVAATGKCSPHVANFGNVGLVAHGKVEQINVE